MKISSGKAWRYVRIIASYCVLIMLSLIFLLPFFWMLSTALKLPSDIYKVPLVWIPKPPTLGNVAEGWGYVDFTRYLFNTLVITVSGTIGTMFSSALVAYGFARFPSRWNGILFTLVIATLMLPSQVSLIPSYVMFSKLRWINTYLPLVLPGWLGGGAFNIFLLRQFFRSVPKELDQAAEIDGCGSFRIFVSILLPVIKPALTTVGIMSVIFYWNDFLGPLIYLTSDSKYTISIGLQYFNSSYGLNKVHLLMAVSLVTILPVIALFFAAQRYFVQGITVTGIKG